MKTSLTNRRRLLRLALSLPFVPATWAAALAGTPTAPGTGRSRVRPGEALWPSESQWAQLAQDTGDALLKVRSPWSECLRAASSAGCAKLFKSIRNPYFLGDDVALTQSLGWVDAWTSRPSAYAVASRNA